MNLELSADEQRTMRRGLLIDQYGTPEAQKSAIVEKILETFCTPEKWPMGDKQRIELLQELYRMAVNVNRTENP